MRMINLKYIYLLIIGITGLSSMIAVVWITDNYYEDIVKKIKLPYLLYSLLWDIGACICMVLNGFIQRTDIYENKKDIIFCLLLCIAIILINVSDIKMLVNTCLYVKTDDYAWSYDRGKIANVFFIPLIKMNIVICINDGIAKKIGFFDFDFIENPIYIILLILNAVANVVVEYRVKKYYDL